MNPEAKALWLAALRSGDYQQTRSKLHVIESQDPDITPGWCCLGVLCDVAAKAGVPVSRGVKHFTNDWFLEDEIDPEDLRLTVELFADTEDYAYLPLVVQQWAGVDHSPIVGVGGVRDSLATINDHGAPFSEIADLIEEHL